MIEHFFSTPIFYRDLDNIDAISKEIDSVLEKSDIHNAVDVWGDNVDTSFVYSKQGTNDVLNHCSILKESIHSAVDDYMQGLELDITKYNKHIFDSWLNVNHKYQFQHFHSHAFNGCDGISGVYYHRSTNDGNDGMLVFKNPSHANAVSNLLRAMPERVYHKPIEGRLILFPSFLEHAVNHNTTDTSRVSLSFNINIEVK